MERRLTEHDGRMALRDHVLEKARAARGRHGPVIDHDAILRLLDDREVVRYPVGVRFDAGTLRPGEFAHAEPLGDHPSRGFCLFIHPLFEHRREVWPLLIAYHIPPVNYGEIAGAGDCELFGATLLGLEADEYYRALCTLADSIPSPGPPP
jgi:hypothetical protein